MSSGLIIAGVASAVVGAGASMYAANKNKKAINDANKTNQEIANDTNERNYQMWLESRGQMADGTAVNAKLPRWMTARVNGTPNIKRALVKKGQPLPAASQIQPYAGVKSSPYLSSKTVDKQVEEKAAAETALKKKKGDGRSILDPAGIFSNSGRSTVSKVLDPFGIF